ncbi:MAG: hypothetical protein K2J88_02375 [Oscillospiraceae bacterium]|nr:hypothetical protein [Oscillospiraceae bacterium]
MNQFFKKAVATLAVVSLFSSAMPLSASAVTYDPCDVNHDGVVTATDYLATIDYVSGRVAGSKYNQYDADRNLIVDYNDYQCVVADVMGKGYTPKKLYSKSGGFVPQSLISNAISNASGFVLNTDSSSRATRLYKKYSYKTKQESTYTLRASADGLNNSASPCDVVGDDDRGVFYSEENSGIVRITTDTGKQATGFIVGDHLIATSASAVYDRGIYNDFYDSLTVDTYNPNGSLKNKKLNVVEAHIPEEYYLTSKYDARYDYALISVSDDLSGYYQFNLGTAYDTNTATIGNVPIYLTGCPSELSINIPNDKLHTEENRIVKLNTTTLQYANDSTEGQEGSPVYAIIGTGGKDLKATAIAICGDSAGNVGSLITYQHLMFYMANSHIAYK